MIVITVLLVVEKTESRAVWAWTGHILVLTLHHTLIQGHTDFFKALRIEDALKFRNSELFITILGAALQLKKIDIVPDFRYMELFNGD